MDSFSARKLKEAFAPLRAQGVVRSQLVVKDMSRTVDAIFLEQDERTIRTAFILSTILWDVAERFWEGPVKEGDVEELWRVMHQPVIRSVDFILDVENDENTITSNLLTAYAKVRKFFTD